MLGGVHQPDEAVVHMRHGRVQGRERSQCIAGGRPPETAPAGFTVSLEPFAEEVELMPDGGVRR